MNEKTEMINAVRASIDEIRRIDFKNEKTVEAVHYLMEDMEKFLKQLKKAELEAGDYSEMVYTLSLDLSERIEILQGEIDPGDNPWPDGDDQGICNEEMKTMALRQLIDQFDTLKLSLVNWSFIKLRNAVTKERTDKAMNMLKKLAVMIDEQRLPEQFPEDFFDGVDSDPGATKRNTERYREWMGKKRS